MKESRRATFEFNFLAPLYDRVSRLFGWRAPERLFDRIMDDTADTQIRTVLDVGTGTGLLAGLFRAHARATDKNIKIAGIDLSLPMLRRGRDKKIAGIMVQGDISEGHLPFLDGTFDVVAACGVMDFIGAPDALAAEMARVAAPGGIVAVTYLMAPRDRAYTRKGGIGVQHSYSPAAINRAFARAGVTPVSSETFTAYSQILPVKYGIFTGRVSRPSSIPNPES